MATLTPEQRRRRARIERLIGLMAPGLNLVLSAGERISRVVEPEDTGYYPPRPAGAGPPPSKDRTPGTSAD